MIRVNIDGVKTIYLNIAEGVVTDKPVLITTVLGSCVGITLYCKRLHLGGMAHCFLPGCSKYRDCKFYCQEGYKYVDCAVRRMVDKFLRKGAEREEIEARIFGGATMMQTSTKGKLLDIGNQNIAAARKSLFEKKIKIVRKFVGGSKGIKVSFEPYSGIAKADVVRKTNELPFTTIKSTPEVE